MVDRIDTCDYDPEDSNHSYTNIMVQPTQVHGLELGMGALESRLPRGQARTKYNNICIDNNVQLNPK